MPDATVIDAGQREGIYELVRNHLGSIEDFWAALERTRGFAAAERLGREFVTRHLSFEYLLFVSRYASGL